VTLSANALLTASAITFLSTVDGAFGLTATATGLTTFDGAVGSGTKLASLTVTNGVDLNGGSVATTGAQDYDGPVTLSANATLISASGSIAFVSTVDGAHALSVSASSGSIGFGGLIGGVSPLASLTANATTVALSGIGSAGSVGVTGSASITANGLIAVDGSIYHTGGTESFAGPVTLLHDVSVISNTGNVTFTSTIDGVHALSVTASAGTVGVGGVIGGVSALTSLAITGANGVQVTSVHTDGAQSYTSAHTITIGGVYDTANGSFTANGAVSLASATTIDPGSGTLVISGALTGSANFTVLGSGIDSLASMNLNTGTLDLSGKTAGSFTVTGVADAAALITGTNNYSLALLGGGNISDPTLANTGGDTLAGSFVFADGLTIPGTLTLAGNTTLDTETSGITLGPVQQGSNTFIVIADAVSLNGPWTGTGPRGITPFSNSLSIGLGDGASGSWILTTADLQILADPPSFVVIGGGTAIGAEIQDININKSIFVPPSSPGPIDIGTFTFNAPLFLIGSSIVLDGTLSKTTGGVGFITPGSITGPGSLDLGPGTGILAVAANNVDINGTVNGSGGHAAAQDTFLVGPLGQGPYLINGVCFAGASCATRGTGLNPLLLGSLVLYANNPSPGDPGTPTGDTTGGGGLGDISPSGGLGSDTSAPTDAAVDALSGLLNTKPPSQLQPRLQGYCVSLLGGMLCDWRDPSRASTSNGMPEENTEFSGWGNEARW
jgi:hypothetical protein